MTQTQQTDSKTTGRPNSLAIKIFGVGGAGSQMVGLLLREGLEQVTCAAVNTDGLALASCAVAEKIQLGAGVLPGLVGGDPERARAAAEAEAAQLRAACEGVDMAFIVAGLGGGAGTGASPVLARLAKEAGALVLAFVTLPFDWEGSRRHDQARLGLQQLKEAADGVICLPNQKVLKLIDEKTRVTESFKITNDMLSQVLRCFWRLLLRPGVVNVNFADLCAVVRGRNAQSCFAAAEAMGENRAREVVEKLLANPLLDGGKVLNDATAVLVSMVGAPDLTMAEINRVMEQINRQCENAHVIMGASLEENLAGRLAVTIVASQRIMAEEAAAFGQENESLAENGTVLGTRVTEAEAKLHAKPAARSSSRFVPPPPTASPEKAKQLLTQQNASGSRRPKLTPQFRQSQLPLEIVSKGRFEKSEPTVRHGEDLDVPTYLRRGVALN